jgi:glycopeptide antibiotics resistance protein
MGSWVWGFASGAVLYAALATAVLLPAARMLLPATAGRAIWRAGPLVFVTLVFVFMTQHPFPDPAALVCPTPGGRVQLQPFHYWETFARLWAQGADLAAWAGNRTVASTVMNFLVCAGIGMVLAGQTARLILAALFGAGLTLAVELTQLTGIWGLYPCAYRQFSVDDLILNASGVVLGFVLARGMIRGLQRMRSR